ncbi:hypothetical protein B296_00027083 [Ensete ventricosum]|uniref:Uncharacterized protein n=1 Tax=Ensete ventricosum TaxID=4639 RepID=A0A426XSF4_ENSVE|nr:hypothetical protein B296_00027083 [Ensete ventricosum]
MLQNRLLFDSIEELQRKASSTDYATSGIALFIFSYILRSCVFFLSHITNKATTVFIPIPAQEKSLEEQHSILEKKVQ